MLEIDDVTIVYPNGETILRDFSLQALPGEITVLLGTNGSGKTTLMRAITGYLPLTSGTIRYNGEDLSRLTTRKRAELISVVPQAAGLPDGYTVYEVVSHGRTPYLGRFGILEARDKTIINRCLEITALESFRDKEIGNLSGGEQQRVILARALAQDTPIMILDEPTSFLDLYHQVQLLNIERQICHEKRLIVLCILHDLTMAARYADKIAVLQDGRIRVCGTPEEVLKEDVLSEVYHTPILVRNNPDLGMVVLPEEIK